MRAVLLAAGRGRRLGREAPKCLLSVGGKTLLARHVANMAESGITALTVVVGFRRDLIEEAVLGLRGSLEIELVQNDEFTRGSILSLHVAAHRIEDGGIWMDADVLYPAALLRRLVSSPHDNCVLVDAGAEETGEEMMVGIRDGRVQKIARRVGPDWHVAGESVGFAKVGAEGGRVMKRLLAEEVGAGRVDQEYEAAMDRAFAEVAFGHERVDDLPWTEIDFEEDVEKAEALVSQL